MDAFCSNLVFRNTLNWSIPPMQLQTSTYLSCGKGGKPALPLIPPPNSTLSHRRGSRTKFHSTKKTTQNLRNEHETSDFKCTDTN